MNGYGSEMDASPPFYWEAVGHKHGLMLHRKIMWRDRYSATGCSPALQGVDSKKAENLLVGKKKSYLENNTNLFSKQTKEFYLHLIEAFNKDIELALTR